LAVLLCCIYPALIWIVAQSVFPEQANGSMVKSGGRIVGSALIAQNFVNPAYFHPRPSSAGEEYNAANSGGSNLGPTSRKLIETVAARINDYRSENNLDANTPVPADAVTASACGLDPHISLQNALLQARRVAASRGITEDDLRKMIAAHTEGRDLGILGEKRVNVLLLNLDLDKRK
ncbi:MAG: K(+)-transporting ATPase subunit C, partial [Smithella sp.]